MRKLRIIGFGLLVLLLVLTGASALSNQTLPTSSTSVERLPEVEKARVAEALHLKASLGDEVWPGWGAADVPVLLSNERNAFLLGHGTSDSLWRVVEGDVFAGTPYRVRRVDALEAELADGELSAFTEHVAGRWAASFNTKEWMQIALTDQIRSELPPFLRPVFPYRVFLSAFGSEWYIAGLLHESFHAFQATTMPTRFADAERSYGASGRYWSIDPSMRRAWEDEIDALGRALDAEGDSLQSSVHDFLALRDRRRAEHGLDSALVAFERRTEWLEGMAKYVELAVWRRAAEDDGYAPLPQMADDPDFGGYRDAFERRWKQERAQMRRQADREGDTRFYYTGMAQALVLDRLRPGWKDEMGRPGVWLDDLLREAAAP